MNGQDVAKYVEEGIKQAPKEVSVYAKWFQKSVPRGLLSGWIDETVREWWGVKAAARCFHTAMTGYDGKVRLSRDLPAHRQAVTTEIEVPGACAPVKNAFHVFQVLTWFANHSETVEKQFERVRDIPELMDALLSSARA